MEKDIHVVIIHTNTSIPSGVVHVNPYLLQDEKEHYPELGEKFLQNFSSSSDGSETRATLHLLHMQQM